MSFEDAVISLALVSLLVFIFGVSFIVVSNNAIKRDNPSVDSQFGILGGVWEWKSQGLKGYVVGLDVADGSTGYMNLLDYEGDLSDNIVMVDLSCLTRVDEE